MFLIGEVQVVPTWFRLFSSVWYLMNTIQVEEIGEWHGDRKKYKL